MAVRRTLYFIPPFPHRVPGSGSDMPFFGLLSRGHGKLSTSPAPWPHGALLLAARPSGFPVSCQKDRPCRTASFPAPPENAELGLGSRCHLPLSARKRAGQKKEIQLMYQNHISLIGFVGT